jgi:NADH-quinone oxidoreductase subunit N
MWAGVPVAGTATLTYLLSYAVTSLAAFGILGVLGRDGERDVTLDSIAGLAAQRPWISAALGICMLSLLGFPGTFGFIGKWLILVSLLGQQQYLLAVILVLASLVSAGYYLPVIMSAYMRAPAGDDSHREVVLTGVAAATVAVAVAAVVVLGFWPTPVLDSAVASSRSFFESIVAGAHHAPR